MTTGDRERWTALAERGTVDLAEARRHERLASAAVRCLVEDIERWRLEAIGLRGHLVEVPDEKGGTYRFVVERWVEPTEYGGERVPTLTGTYVRADGKLGKNVGHCHPAAAKDLGKFKGHRSP